jgi:endonuclease/exonuclease/phosphatase (EEP) superfamily protein YafD
VSVVMEIVAVLLPPLVAGVVLVQVGIAVATRRTPLLASAVSWIVFGVLAAALPWIPHATGHPAGGVKIAVANVMVHNEAPGAAVRGLLAQRADILVVPEDSGPIHDRLSLYYRYARRYPYGQAWLGVFSNVPVKELPPLPGVFDPNRYVRVEVAAETPFVLWAVHLPRPWFQPRGSYQMRPGGQARVLSEVLDAVGKETLPVVMAGDMNLTDRGRGYRKATAHLDDALRSIRGAWSETKVAFRPLLLSIDHILEPPSWCADQAGRFAIAGSDHRGIIARVGPCRAG